MLSVALVNQKGGVGKTAVTLGLASCAATRGLRTLVVDLDPQANATHALGVGNAEWTAHDVLHNAHAGAAQVAAVPSEWPLVDGIAASLSLSECETDASLGAEFSLRESFTDLTGYDLVLIDCPPSVGRLTSNALVAAHLALVVTEAEGFASRGVVNVLESIETIRRYHNPTLDLAGVVVNKWPSPQTRESRIRLAELTEQLGPLVWSPAVPRRAVVAEAAGAARPLHEYGGAATAVSEVLAGHLDRLMALDSTLVDVVADVRKSEPVEAGK